LIEFEKCKVVLSELENARSHKDCQSQASHALSEIRLLMFAIPRPATRRCKNYFQYYEPVKQPDFNVENRQSVMESCVRNKAAGVQVFGRRQMRDFPRAEAAGG